MLATPYTKLLCSQWNVDQAAALVLMAAETAAALGVAARSVGVRARGGGVEPDGADARAGPRSTAGPRSKRSPTRSGSPGPDAIAPSVVELYSCFPAAVQVQAAALGLPLDAPLTVSGGMTFGGGPLNSSVLQGMVPLVGRLRDAAGRDRAHHVGERDAHEAGRVAVVGDAAGRPAFRGDGRDRRGDGRAPRCSTLLPDATGPATIVGGHGASSTAASPPARSRCSTSTAGGRSPACADADVASADDGVRLGRAGRCGSWRPGAFVGRLTASDAARRRSRGRSLGLRPGADRRETSRRRSPTSDADPDRVGRDRWWTIGLVALLVLPLVVSAVYLWFSVGDSYLPTVDWAIFELQHARRASATASSSVRTRASAGTIPGPLLFYVLAGPVQAAGLAVDLDAHHRARGQRGDDRRRSAGSRSGGAGCRSCSTVLVPVGLLTHALGADLLRNPWNPYLPVLPLLLLLLLCLVGRGRRPLDAADRDRRWRASRSRATSGSRSSRWRCSSSALVGHRRARACARRRHGPARRGGGGSRRSSGCRRRSSSCSGSRSLYGTFVAATATSSSCSTSSPSGRTRPPASPRRSRCSACSGARARSGSSARAATRSSATSSSSRAGGWPSGSCSASRRPSSRSGAGDRRRRDTVWLAGLLVVGFVVARSSRSATSSTSCSRTSTGGPGCSAPALGILVLRGALARGPAARAGPRAAGRGAGPAVILVVVLA